MSRLGKRRGPVARLNDQVLRLVGLAFVACAGAVVAASVATDRGLSVTPGTTANAAATDPGTVAALVQFSVAHPAYPVAVLVGLVLVVLGEETPLLGS